MGDPEVSNAWDPCKGHETSRCRLSGVYAGARWLYIHGPVLDSKSTSHFRIGWLPDGSAGVAADIVADRNSV